MKRQDAHRFELACLLLRRAGGGRGLRSALLSGEGRPGFDPPTVDRWLPALLDGKRVPRGVLERWAEALGIGPSTLGAARDRDEERSRRPSLLEALQHEVRATQLAGALPLLSRQRAVVLDRSELFYVDPEVGWVGSIAPVRPCLGAYLQLWQLPAWRAPCGRCGAEAYVVGCLGSPFSGAPLARLCCPACLGVTSTRTLGSYAQVWRSAADLCRPQGSGRERQGVEWARRPEHPRPQAALGLAEALALLAREERQEER